MYMEIPISTTQLVIRALLGVGTNTLMAVIAYKRESVSVSGAITGFVIGFLIYIGGGLLFWLHLGAFFISSTVLGHFKRKEKELSTAQHEKHSTRDGVQVISNAGPGAVTAILYLFFPHPAVLTAFAASFAAANADTWAGEIGMLSSGPPVSIISRQRLPAGASGGVTRLGFYASAAGAAFITCFSCASILFDIVFSTTFGADIITASFIFSDNLSTSVAVTLLFGFIITFCGSIGSVIDSILGATIQAEYQCTVSGVRTERPYTDNLPNVLIKGFSRITNDTVNLISVSAATTTAFIMTILIMYIVV
jgi:uncharacterized protein (TIGR00297 family)